MASMEKVVIPALVIPLLLIISVAVYVKTTDSTNFAFEQAVSAEDTGTDASGAVVSAYTVSDCKYGSVTAVTNGSTAMTAVTDYNVTYNPYEKANITVGAHIDSGDIKATYTALKGDGYDAYDKMNSKTYTGYKLGGTLPFVILAMAILAVVLTGVVMR